MQSTKSQNSSGHSGLPMSRIKVIMRSSPDVESISPSALYAMSKATELFVSHLTTEAYEKNTSLTLVDYKSLADVVNNDDTLEFLQDVVPHKITYKEYMRLSQKRTLEEDQNESKTSD